MMNKIDEFLKIHTYLVFLLTLILWIGVIPLFSFTGIGDDLEFIVSNIIMVSSFYFFHQSNKKRISFFLVPLCLIFLWLDYLLPGYQMFMQLNKVCTLTLFLLITIHFLSIIFRSKEVDAKVIVISIAGYIMVRIMASILCWMTASIYPGAYNLGETNDLKIMDFAYYSIVTMSTLGYGDITPQIPQSRSLAILITLIGQFYMTLLMAFLIGKFLNSNKRTN